MLERILNWLDPQRQHKQFYDKCRLTILQACIVITRCDLELMKRQRDEWAEERLDACPICRGGDGSPCMSHFL